MSKWGRMLIAMLLAALLCLIAAAGFAQGVLTLPESLKTIADEAFAGAQSITEIVLPDGVEAIGSRAFADSAIERINLPKSVASIADDAFAGSDVLATVTQDSYAHAFCEGEGVRFDLIPSDSGVYAYTAVDDGVTIDRYNGNQTVIGLPDAIAGSPVVAIGENAFSGCAATSIKLPKSLLTVADLSFVGCESLERVVVRSSETQFEGFAFLRSNSNLVLVGDVGSAAEAYARAYGIGFEDRATGAILFDSDYGYTIADGTAAINAYTGTETAVELPSDIEGMPVTRIGHGALLRNGDVTGVTVPDGVATIGSQAFAFCSALEYAEIPASVTEIGSRAFQGVAEGFVIYGYTGSAAETYASENGHAFVAVDAEATPDEPEESMPSSFTYTIANEEVTIDSFTGSETEVVIPAQIEGYPVTSIGAYAFKDCSNLTRVEVPQGIKRIGSGAFEYCYGLVSIELPAAVESIESRAFYACENLPDIVIPENAAEIGSEAFRGCKAFTQVVIPAGVRTIGSEAFYGCRNVKEFVIPETVESIGAYALSACSMEMAVVGEAGGYVESYALAYALAFRVNGTDEILFDYDFGARIEDGNAVINLWEARTYDEESGTLVFPAEMNGYPVTAIEPMAGGKTFRKIILPDSLQSIAKATFRHCESMTDVTFGSGAVTIGESAFENCYTLENVTWGGAGSVGDYAFRNCSKLTTLELSTNAKTIGQSAFDSCEALYDIALPEGLESIGQSAFMGCTSLEYVTMPDTVTSIGTFAFSDCILLRDVELSDNLTEISGYMFQGDEQLLLVNIPAKAETIGAYAFSGCMRLYRMTLPESLKTIGRNAFENCGMLSVLTLPESLESVGAYAFAYCSGLTAVSIPQAWDYISEGTFAGCVNLAEVYLHDSIWSIGDSAFSMTGLTYAVLPKEMRSLGAGAYSSCPSLKEVTLPPALTSIGKSAFSTCEALETVSMTEGMTRVGEYMFYNCTSLKNIEFAGTVTEIGQYAFAGCTALEEVTMVEGLETIGARAFQNCDALVLLHMPDSLTTLGSEAFADCDLLGIVEIPSGIQTLYASFVRCPNLREVHIGEQVTTFYVSTDGYGNERHVFTDSPNVKIYTEYGTEAVEFAVEQGISYFYLTPVGFNLPEGNLFWSDAFAHSGVIRCSDPITKVVITLFDASDTTEPVKQAVHTATGQTDYYYAPLLRAQIPFETLDIGSYAFEVEAYVDTDQGEKYEMLAASVFDVIELPFRYGSPDGFEPPQLLYVAGSTYTPTGTIESNYVMDSVQVRIHKHAQQYPMEGVTLTPGTKSVSAAALHEGIDLSTFETGRYEYGIYAMCNGEERAMYEETFVIANYDGEMSEEDAQAIVSFCNKSDAHATFSGFKDYRDILDEISDLDMYLMGISNRNEIAMAEIIAAASASEKGYVVGLYKAQILDLLDRMDDSTQLIDPSVDISIEKQMMGVFSEGMEYTHDEFVARLLQSKYNYHTALTDYYGERYSGSKLRKIVDEKYAQEMVYFDQLSDEIDKFKTATKIGGYTIDFIKILSKAAGEYQNMMLILDSLMDAYEGSVPTEFNTALEQVRAEYQDRACIIVTEILEKLKTKVVDMAIDKVTGVMFETIGGSAALTYKVAEFVLDVGLLVSGEKEKADNNFKFLTRMNLAIESNEAFKRMVDQVQGGDASAETLRKTKTAFDATQMAFEGLYELMITGYSDHANLSAWKQAQQRLNALSIL